MLMSVPFSSTQMGGPASLTLSRAVSHKLVKRARLGNRSVRVVPEYRSYLTRTGLEQDAAKNVPHVLLEDDGEQSSLFVIA